MHWYPQAPLAASQVRHGRLFCCWKRHWFMKNVSFCKYVQILCICAYWKTPDGRGTPFYTEKWSNFVMSFHLDLIGDQNDIQYLLIYYLYLAYLVLYLPGSVARLSLLSQPRITKPRKSPCHYSVVTNIVSALLSCLLILLGPLDCQTNRFGIP